MKCKDCLRYSQFTGECEEHSVPIDGEQPCLSCPDYCREVGDSFSFLRELKDIEPYCLIKR